jgi:hypothetical protein
MLHRISMLVAAVMVALSIFFVFRPHQPFSRIQPPLAPAVCADPPENTVMVREYSCEKP